MTNQEKSCDEKMLVKAAAGASLEVALTGWERVLPHRKNDWP